MRAKFGLSIAGPNGGGENQLHFAMMIWALRFGFGPDQAFRATFYAGLAGSGRVPCPEERGFLIRDEGHVSNWFSSVSCIAAPAEEARNERPPG